jgi:hypothetical protein
MTMVLACAMRTARSIQIGTPATASGSIPLAYPHGVVLSAINRTSTPRSFARSSASTIPEPVVRPKAPTKISRSALSIARNCEGGALFFGGEFAQAPKISAASQRRFGQFSVL